MASLGLCVSPRILMADGHLSALRPPFTRSILYDVVDDLDWLLSLGAPILLTLNNEADMVRGWAGWQDALRYIGPRIRGRTLGVTCGNELDVFWAQRADDVPPSFGARLVQQAQEILEPLGIPVGTTTLGGPRWPEYLAAMLRECSPDFVALNPYGWVWDGIDAKAAAVRQVAPGLPIVFPELGVKIMDAGGEEGVSEALQRAARECARLDIDAAWFAYHDAIGKPEERGPSAFGLVRDDGTTRPAFAAYAALHVPKEAPVPTRAELVAYARQTATRAGYDPTVMERQVQQESGFDPNAHNDASGADGIGQIVVRWHPTMAGKTRDPIVSLDYMADLMASHMRSTNGDAALALSYYNAGPGATQQGLAGTLDGWPYAETVRYVANILQISQQEATRRLTGDASMGVTFNPNTAPIRQNDPWSCAPTSARWAMTALGRQPSEQWFEDTMLAEGVVTQELGLMDATGAGLAAFIRRHYDEFGYDANHEPSISFDWAAAEGDHAYPVLIGGRGWNHWAVLTGYDAATDQLLLMNPAGTWMGVGDTMSRAQFGALGPFSAVRVWHPDLLGAAPPAPPVPPTPPAADTRIARALERARDVVKILEEVAPS